MAFAAAMLVVALAIIYRGNFNEEGNVYLAFLNEAKNQAHDAAFLSTPSTCQGATKENVPTASSDLFSDFYSANGNGAAPINLRALEGLFNVVSFEEAKQREPISSAFSNFKQDISKAFQGWLRQE